MIENNLPRRRANISIAPRFSLRPSITSSDWISSLTRKYEFIDIKAFNHKFRLDLELNTQLIAPNIMQKHYLANGAEQVSKQEIEHCYYHGTVQDYPGATAAFHTCNGVSGVIHVGNETFVIHPFYGGDLSKHPHVIFEARTKANKGCANTGNMDWRPKSHSGFLPTLNRDRLRRDVREATKYIETALVIDKAMFEKRNGSTRAEVVHDSIQVANIADLYFRTLNTRVSVVYVETWQGGNQAQIDRNQDIGKALTNFNSYLTTLTNFNSYLTRKMFKVDKDTTQLLTGEIFVGGEAGMAAPATVCGPKAVGISVDINTYEPHLLAGTMAHMIGHNIGMGHDDGREECYCRDWHGCIMAQAIVGLDNVQPYKFSECSRSDYVDRLRTGNGICLMNKPNELEVRRSCGNRIVRRSCGNRIVEDGEDCDCGTIEDCSSVDPCCDPITCKLTKEAECAKGPCCENCKLRERGYTCREITNDCDLPEYCNGETGDCPPDVYKKNGSPCTDNGYCLLQRRDGRLSAGRLQEERFAIWGYGGIGADVQCFDQFNSKGSISGHCGQDVIGRFVKCAPENVRCGSLQCHSGNRNPVSTGLGLDHTRTIISTKGVEYECKSVHRGPNSSGNINQSINPFVGLVQDGTPCGESLICVNQTCSSIFPHVDQTKCPTNHEDKECSGNGFCTNANTCFCHRGWTGPDCSIEDEIVPTPPYSLPTPPYDQNPLNMDNLTSVMQKKETPYEDYHGSNTVFLVGTLMSVVGGVFIVFATLALCYRSVVVHKNFSLCLRKSTDPKYEKDFVKEQIPKKYVAATGNHSQEDTLDNASKIIPFSSSYGRADSQRVLFRSSNHMAAGGSTHFQEHKMQQLKRMAAGAGSEDDAGHSGEEETVSFIDLPHNSRTEKKGILKKHGEYSIMIPDGKENWAEAGQPDGMLSQQEATMNQILSGVSMSEVERTLKSLNGYHEDILKALRTAASHRGTATTPSGSSTALSDEVIRRSLQECAASSYPDYKRSSSQEKICEAQVVVEAEDEDDDDVPPCGPIRIRNLEDLIRRRRTTLRSDQDT
ncbi:Disintegrin [Popillia japonica]|uniref:Disintegrin n=1 Tax=Popillia japonica TaxID=7064 RepID=A0AAW1N488_POPJA